VYGFKSAVGWLPVQREQLRAQQVWENFTFYTQETVLQQLYR